MVKLLEGKVTRRSTLIGGAAAALVWASRPLIGTVRAQQSGPAIVAAKVAQVPTEPDDSAWTQAAVATIPMNPQNLQLPRLMEAGAKSINVSALYDSDRFALLLEWVDAHRNVELGTVLDYRDGMAVQFPEDPSQPTPLFMMGQKGNGVVIYHWKSDWQFGRLYDVDEAYPNMYGDFYQFSGVPAGEMPEAIDYLTSGKEQYLTAAAVGNSLADPRVQETIGAVQKMRAEGFGTIEPNTTQDGSGKGAFENGTWKIVVSVPRRQANFTLEEGGVLPLSFAVWDGSRSERNGQKAYSQHGWDSMSLGTPIVGATPTAVPTASPTGTPTSSGDGGGSLFPILGGAFGVIAAATAAVVGFRLWRTRR